MFPISRGYYSRPKRNKKTMVMKKRGEESALWSMWKVCIGSQTFSSLDRSSRTYQFISYFCFPLKPSATCVTLQSLESILLDVSVNYIIEGWIYDSSILDYQSRLGTHCQSTFERQCIENPGTPVAIHFIVTTLSVLPSTLEPLVTWSVYPLFGSWKLRFVRMPSPPIKPMDHPH